MRNVPATQALTNVRSISGRLTFTDYRLRFQSLPASEDPSQYYAYADTEINGGVLQVCVQPGGGLFGWSWMFNMYYRFVPNFDAPLPPWKLMTSYASYYPLNIAFYGNRLFVGVYGWSDTYGTPHNQCYYTDFVADVWTPMTSFGPNLVGACQSFYQYKNNQYYYTQQAAMVAPVSQTEVYVLTYTQVYHNWVISANTTWPDGRPHSYSSTYVPINNDPFIYGKIDKYNVGTGLVASYPGRIYDTAFGSALDAVRIGNTDTIYGTEEAGSRTWFVEYDGVNWSEKKFVIPMDVTDTVTGFTLKSASVLNGKPVITGLMTRDSGQSMLVYSIGPDRYTLGRDLFIGIHGTNGIGGSLHLIGNNLYYVGIGFLYKAPATTLVGCNNPAMTFTTQGIIEAQLTCASNNPNSMQIDLQSNIAHPSIVGGSKVKIESCVNGEYSDIGTYNIDSAIHTREDVDQKLTIVGRSEVMKNIDMWQSDAPFDYWSQTKVSTVPAKMSDVIRAAGMWTANPNNANELTTYDLNGNGILYTSANTCHNGMIRGRFRRTAGNYNGRFGLGLGYYLETAAEAGLRLGIDSTAVTESQFGHNGVFCVFGKTEVGGTTEGVGVYLVDTSVWTQIANAPVTLTDGVNYWVMISMNEGMVRVSYKVDGATLWTPLLVCNVESTTSMPWKEDYEGAGAVYMQNYTGYATCKSMSGNFMIVDSLSRLTAADTLICDNEQMTFTSQNPLPNGLSANNTRSINPPTLLSSYVTGDGTSGVPLGDVAAHTKLRQHLFSGSAGNSDAIGFSVYKVGNPIDNLVITITSTAGVAKVTKSISGTLLSTDQRNIYYSPILADIQSTALLATDYVQFSRDGSLDPNNYYIIGYGDNPSENVQTAANSVAYFNTTWGTGDITLGNLGFYTLLAPLSGYTWTHGDSLSFTNDCFVNLGAWFPAYDPSNYYGSLLMDASADQWAIVKNNDITVPGYTGYQSMLFVPPALSIPNQQIALYPTLNINLRDLTNVGQTTHIGSIAHIYRPGPFVFISALEYFDSLQDMSLEDMVANIVGKVGTYPVLPSLIYPASVIPSAVNTAINKSDFVMNFTIDHTITGTIVIQGRADTAYTSKVAITFNGATVSYTSSGTLIDSFTKTDASGNPVNFWGTVTVCFYQNFVSIYCGGAFVYSFTLQTSDWNSQPDTVIDSTNYVWISGTETTAITVHFAEACQRIDNWILDEGKTGTDLMSELIGEKHFYYQDGYDANMNPGLELFFRGRAVVNSPSTPYLLAITEANNENDVGLATRMRVEGSEIAEALDEACLIRYGNIFRLMNLNETLNMSDASYWASENIYEANSTAEGENLTGACDPRIEPNDIIYVQTARGVVEVRVDTIDIDLATTNTDATFDMTITGYVPEEAYTPQVFTTRQIRAGAICGMGLSDQNRWRSL